MRLLERKNEPERLFETVGNSLEELAGNVTKGRLVKAGLVAGGVVGLVAGSAGISSLRRRLEGARNDS
ncbi:MAG TPA: hypothetical protein VKA45_02390 [Gaiellaceae bacterium]|nr:hypothetical protein [Gaiellaceae bacterium]